MNKRLVPSLVLALAVSIPLLAPSSAFADPNTPILSNPPAGVSASPVDSSATTAARAELASLDARASELTTRVEAASRDLTAARTAHDAALNAVSAAHERLESAQSSFDSYVTGAYKSGPGAQAAAYLTLVDPRESGDLSALGKLEHVGSRQADGVTELRAARTELERTEAVAATADTKASGILADLDRDRSELEGTLAKKRAELTTLVAADTASWAAEVAAAREAEARRQAAALELAAAAASAESSDGLEETPSSAPGGGSAAGRGSVRDLPSASVASLDAASSAIAAAAAALGADTAGLDSLAGRDRVVAAADALLRAQEASAPGSVGFVNGRPQGAVAVEAALAQLGDPYVWGAVGPGSFDCSGLTMWGWKAAGVSLPHYSRSQLSTQTKVSVADLRPGDLVFFGSPVHHVGMYLGGGLMVHAPHTGDVVKVAKVSAMGSSYAGASRPA